jgi:hypothetical protein
LSVKEIGDSVSGREERQHERDACIGDGEVSQQLFCLLDAEGLPKGTRESLSMQDVVFGGRLDAEEETHVRGTRTRISKVKGPPRKGTYLYVCDRLVDSPKVDGLPVESKGSSRETRGGGERSSFTSGRFELELPMLVMSRESASTHEFGLPRLHGGEELEECTKVSSEKETIIKRRISILSRNLCLWREAYRLRSSILTSSSIKLEGESGGERDPCSASPMTSNASIRIEVFSLSVGGEPSCRVTWSASWAEKRRSCHLPEEEEQEEKR